MKKLYFLVVFVLCLTSVQAQRFVQYSEDSSRIKYAAFEEAETRGITSENFFSSFLGLDPQNRFIPTDTLYSPDSSYTYIKYRQQYADYEAEGAMVTLTYHNHCIIRFNGYYIPANNLLLRNSFSDNDAIAVFKQYYHSQNDSCLYFVSKLVTHDPLSNKAQLCFQVLSTEPSLYSKILYLSTDDLSIIREDILPSAGFNATFCTMYNGIRYGYDWAFDPYTHMLRDTIAAVQVYSLGYNEYVGDIQGFDSPIFNNSSYWCNDSYPQYMLDAYWSATQFSYYLQHKFHYPKHYFQRFWNYQSQSYEVNDTLTPIYIATNTYSDQTFWSSIYYHPAYSGRLPHQPYWRNIIVIGAPGPAHNPKASIDETVHEYAHIFSFQNWYHHNHLPLNYGMDLAEACADIWAAIITSQVYPDEEDKIWRIGEDVVLPTSTYTCIRNIEKPTDERAEIQMFDNNCQSTAGDAYERSGVISHWFYLLTHGYSGIGCDGTCYSFPSIPIDSAAKLLFYCETGGFFTTGLENYEDICQATLDATVNFSNPEDIKTSVIGAWNVLGVWPFTPGIGHFGLSYNSLNEETYIVNKNLVIDSARTLTIKGTVHLGDTCSIIIHPGSKLVVDGGTLTSSCSNKLWQGIQVVGDRTKHQLALYQGSVELRNSATIENAHCAIHTGLYGNAAYATAGGIISAEDAHFVNNRRSVAFVSYMDTLAGGSLGDNVSQFRNTEFIVNDNNLFAANNCGFIDHVTLWQVKGVEFEGCTFKNQISGVSDHRHAVYAENAGFSLMTYCEAHASPQPECECPEEYATHCYLSGFTNAVELLTTGDPYPVTIDGAQFSNNTTGVRINANNVVTVTRCSFDLQSTPEIANTSTGLILNRCNGYKVEGNDFFKNSSVWIPKPTGISVTNSGPRNNSIYRNTFNKMRYGIHVSDTNGSTFSGLTFSCNEFTNCEYGIYAAQNSSLAPSQGSLSKGVDNIFSGTQTSSFYNLGNTRLIYYHSNGSNLYLTNPTGVAAESDLAASNSCSSTLCDHNGGGSVYLAGFQSDMNAYTTALAATADAEGMENGDGAGVETQNLESLQQALSKTYYDAVRAIMSDSLLDLYALEQWHTAAQPIADPYSLTETRFCEGYSETFSAASDDAELSNYAEFHALKLALRNNDAAVGANNYSPLQPDGHVNWYTLTPAQIAQLQVIAERNTGRASVMAKGVLCFFFGICYEDEEDTDPSAETQAKRAATGDEGVFDTPLRVWPNPTDDLLFVELRGAEIATVALYDLQGRVVETRHGTSLQGGTATVNMRNVPAGVYVLRVTAADGKEYRQKIVRR